MSEKLNSKKHVLITGAAGFVGFHTALRFLKEGCTVFGFDSISDYYDVNLKLSRIEVLSQYEHFKFKKGNLEDDALVKDVVGKFRPNLVLHFAAQAGVRHSFTHPKSYIGSNIIGTFNLLEALKLYPSDHLILASTSSVYGSESKVPAHEGLKANTPISLYAATKKATEVISHSYSHLYGLPITAARFFTVYGPWGRPDMALYKFTSSIINGLPIELYNSGEMIRDFTFVDDLVDTLFKVASLYPVRATDTNGLNKPPYRILNIGNSKPVKLMDYLSVLEDALGKTAQKTMLPIQPGEVIETFADNNKLLTLIGKPKYTPIEVGIPKFVEWFNIYNKI